MIGLTILITTIFYFVWVWISYEILIDCFNFQKTRKTRLLALISPIPFAVSLVTVFPIIIVYRLIRWVINGKALDE